MAYLNSRPASGDADAVEARLNARLQQSGKPIVTREGWERLERVEQEEGKRRGVTAFKFASNVEMLAAIEGKIATDLA